MVTGNDYEKIIGYWIETTYVWRTLGTLDEYVDEVSENYDFEGWLNIGFANDNHIHNFSGMLEECESYAYNLQKNAEERLKFAMQSIIESKAELLKLQKSKIGNKYLEYTIANLHDNFEKIYDYYMPVQLSNFYKTLEEILETLSKETSYDSRN